MALNDSKVHFVLVSNIDAQNEPWYYAGYYLKHVQNGMTFCVPANSAKYKLALKLAYRDEADSLCKEINKQPHFKYHVEEHKQ